MDKSEAKKKIAAIFSKYGAVVGRRRSALLQALSDGKLYELFVLAHLLKDLDLRGFRITFRGSSLAFKASPGKIKRSDPHFELMAHTGVKLWVFVDIEFETLGRANGAYLDRSAIHELDIVVVAINSGTPKHSDILLGVECKAVANFTKSIVKETLGVRRELALLTAARQSTLTGYSSPHSAPVNVPADPPSEYRLAFTDPKGNNYRCSPEKFGIEFWWLEP